MATAAPPTLTVQNTDTEAIIIQSVQIEANESYTWAAADMAAVCTDIYFRAAFVSGLINLTIAGYTFTMSSIGIVDMLDQIAAGTIG